MPALRAEDFLGLQRPLCGLALRGAAPGALRLPPRVRHVAGVQGTAFGLEPQHPTTGTSAAPVQRQGFGFAPVLAILTRSHSLRSLALRLPGCSGLALDPAPPLPCWRLFGFGMEKVSRAAPEAAAERKGEALSTERVRMQARSANP